MVDTSPAKIIPLKKIEVKPVNKPQILKILSSESTLFKQRVYFEIELDENFSYLKKPEDYTKGFGYHADCGGRAKLTILNTEEGEPRKIFRIFCHRCCLSRALVFFISSTINDIIENILVQDEYILRQDNVAELSHPHMDRHVAITTSLRKK